MSSPAAFEGKDFYEVLGVTRSATAKEIKKAYRKQALRYHPDHNHSESAKEEFQHLCKVHEVLSDEAKRKYYDKHGEVQDPMSADFDKAYDYWRSVFPAISEEDIEAFRKEYVGSDMEREDLARFFTEHKGKMDLVLQCVPYACGDEAERLCAVVEAMLAGGQLKEAKKADRKRFAQSRKGLAARMKEEEGEEAEEAEEALRDLKQQMPGGGGDGDLFAMIRARQANREQQQNNFLDGLLERANERASKGKENSRGKVKGKGKAKGRGKRKGAHTDAMCDEEAFQEARKRLHK